MPKPYRYGICYLCDLPCNLAFLMHIECGQKRQEEIRQARKEEKKLRKDVKKNMADNGSEEDSEWDGKDEQQDSGEEED